MENKPIKITLAITIILLLVAVGYIFNKEYIEPKNMKYVEEGAMRVIQEINQKGNIPVITYLNVTPEGYEGMNINWISITQLCQTQK